MKEQLITLLTEAFGFPIFLQGSLNPDEPYPESFFTFWVYSAPEAAFYDNEAGRAVWGFWLYFYSTDPALVESVPNTAKKLLKANGWIPQGKPTDATTARPTHTGMMLNLRVFEDYPESD